jgi:hypothetical protein
MVQVKKNTGAEKHRNEGSDASQEDVQEGLDEADIPGDNPEGTPDIDDLDEAEGADGGGLVSMDGDLNTRLLLGLAVGVVVAYLTWKYVLSEEGGSGQEVEEPQPEPTEPTEVEEAIANDEVERNPGPDIQQDPSDPLQADGEALEYLISDDEE